jgi:hypothetical protein
VSPDTVTIIGSVVAAALGGGTVTGLLTYFRDRRKDKGDVVLSTFTNLRDMNALLTSQVLDLQSQLDGERNQRRALEDTVDTERRARRALEERIAVLERRTEEGEPT